MEKLELLKKKIEENSTFEYYNNILSNETVLAKWSEDILYDSLPFDVELTGMKRGKIYSKPPKNRSYKTENFFSVSDEFIGAFSYIPNWDEPSFYVFAERKGNQLFLYGFDIKKELTSVFVQEYKNKELISVHSLNKNGDSCILQIHNSSTSLTMELSMGLSINDIGNRHTRSIKILFNGNDLISISEHSHGLESKTIFEGINPYMERSCANPLTTK